MGEKYFFNKIDWALIAFVLPILGAGLLTMNSFSGDSSYFTRQIYWIIFSLIIFVVFSFIDFSFLKKTNILVFLFLAFSGLLAILFFLGQISHGAQSWFDLGGFSFQPSDVMKLVLILVLSKYFSRRHIEIANIKHIIISGLYTLVPFVLVLLQPDFGSAMIIFLIWFGMALVSGISKRHLFLVFGIGVLAISILWVSVFQMYQKERIINFLNPLTDIHGSGYNAYQSTIAVGSGKLLGKDVGFGTQSRLQFLPEYETDFVFSAFAEEWGFVGSLFILLLFSFVIWKVLLISIVGATNFEILFGLGVAIFFSSHIIINIGMNIGILPVTGITLPFMSYGGSHLVTEFAALGILSSMKRYSRAAHRDEMKNEFLGI